MNYRSTRREQNRQKFLDSLKSDRGTTNWQEETGVYNHPAKLKWLKHSEILQKKKAECLKGLEELRGYYIPDFAKGFDNVYGMQIAAGVFGEGEHCNGIVEGVLKPEEGGTFMKIYGCPVIAKGHAKKEIVYGIQLAKAILSSIPREIIGKSWLNMAFLGFKFLFARDQLLKELYFVFHQIDQKVLKHYDIPEKEYNVFAKELKRAVDKAIEGENNQWGKLIEKAVKFLRLFLEIDNGYRNRVQDALGEIREGSLSEFWRIYGILESRELGITAHWKFIKLVLKAAFLLSPTLRRITIKFLENLDVSKIKMDKADWYFCLNFKSYNFGGLTHEDRLKERSKLNKEYGVVFLI